MVMAGFKAFVGGSVWLSTCDVFFEVILCCLNSPWPKEPRSKTKLEIRVHLVRGQTLINS